MAFDLFPHLRNIIVQIGKTETDAHPSCEWKSCMMLIHSFLFKYASARDGKEQDLVLIVKKVRNGTSSKFMADLQKQLTSEPKDGLVVKRGQGGGVL